MKDLFDTEEKVNLGIAAFRGLLNDPGWKLLEQILDANIEILRERLENGTEEETKEDIDVLRKQLAIFRQTRNMPNIMIEKLESSEGVEPNDDPFLSVEELAKKRNT